MATHNSQTSNSAWTSTRRTTRPCSGGSRKHFCCQHRPKGRLVSRVCRQSANPIDASVSQVSSPPTMATTRCSSTPESKQICDRGGRISSNHHFRRHGRFRYHRQSADARSRFQFQHLLADPVRRFGRGQFDDRRRDARRDGRHRACAVRDGGRVPHCRSRRERRLAASWRLGVLRRNVQQPKFPAEFSGHNALQFADFNNDGWQDLIVATMGGGGVAPNPRHALHQSGRRSGG